MLVVSILTSAFVACFVLKKVWNIYKKGKVIQKRSEEEALLVQASQGHSRSKVSTATGLPNSDAAALGAANGQNVKNGMTEGQRFKFAFLIGLFFTNLSRFVILLYDGLAHGVYEKSESQIRSSTVALAFMDLPTLGLMTSFSLFIYYIA